MNRRTALKQVFIISAGAAIIPACVQNDAPAVALKKLSVTGKQEKLLAALCNIIIPSTPEFYGAAEVKAHEFVLMMVDECESPEVQKLFENGIKAFDKKVDKDFGNSFAKLDNKKQIEVLNQLESKGFKDEDIEKFYGMTKNYTILAFTSSSKYMTDVRKYKMVPGSNFKGCVMVS